MRTALVIVALCLAASIGASATSRSERMVRARFVNAAAPKASAAKRVFLEADGIVTAPQAWVRTARADSGAHIKVWFAIKLRNTAALKAKADEVSDPRNPNYGQYLTLAQVNDMVRPTPLDTKKVLSFASSIPGARNVHVSQGGDFVVCEAPVAAMEQTFDVTLHAYTHKTRRDLSLVRADRHYSLPGDVAASIDYVDGLTRFPNVRTPRATPVTEEAKMNPMGLPKDTCGGKCWVDLTPVMLKTRYNVSTTLGKDSKNVQAVAEFEGQYYSPKNLEQFQTDCKQPVQPVSKVIGPNVADVPGIESSLDIQWIMAMGGNVSTEFWSFAEYSLSDWLLKIGNTTDAPLVHSVSYGNDEVQNGLSYMERVNTELQKTAVRGISIIFASGDQGVYGRTGGSGVFHPDFPGGSPYVTAVGATQFTKDTIDQEVGSSWSGGGFSNTFSRPSYQNSSVAQYINEAGRNLPDQTNWNSTGRGYPDVSANGGGASKFCVLVGLFYTGVSGTSASAPTFAGIISLLNDLRLQNNKPALGFLNPWIYQTAASTPGAFDDVTDCDQGSNGAGSGKGFAAGKGWDPVTGVGNPNYEVLAKAVLA